VRRFLISGDQLSKETVMAITVTTLQISGSGVFSLGTGAEVKRSRCNLSVITPLTTSGSLTVQRKTAASPSASNSYYTRYIDGQTGNGALSSSADVWVESGGSEIFVSSSISAGIATLFFSHVSDT
jgi:hypothetical protein